MASESLKGRRGMTVYRANGRPGGSIVSRPASTSQRLILAIDNQGSCSLPSDTMDKHEIQQASSIFAAKVDVAKFESAMNNLSQIIRSNTSSGLRMTLQTMTVFGIPFIFHRIRRRQRLVYEAVDEMNRTIFEPAGVYAKTQMCFVQVGRARQQTSWLSIALTPDEVATLRSEGHVFKYRLSSGDIVELEPGHCCGCFTYLCGRQIVV